MSLIKIETFSDREKCYEVYPNISDDIFTELSLHHHKNMSRDIQVLTWKINDDIELLDVSNSYSTMGSHYIIHKNKLVLTILGFDIAKTFDQFDFPSIRKNEFKAMQLASCGYYFKDDAYYDMRFYSEIAPPHLLEIYRNKEDFNDQLSNRRVSANLGICGDA